MEDVVIVDAVRTPMGRSKGGIFRNVGLVKLRIQIKLGIGKQHRQFGPCQAFLRQRTAAQLFVIRQEFDEAFKKVDALITPTSPTVPFKIGEKSEDPLQMYLSDVCTIPINIAGIPAVSIPAGFADNLPVGMQVIGKPFSEETIFQVAYAYQQVTDWHKRHPPIF